jgi:hypothetical protein
MSIFQQLQWWLQDKCGQIREYFYERKLKKLYPDYNGDDEYNCGTLKFIWGVKSWDDLCPADTCLYTMNDIDICYDRETKKYMLGVETAYMFKDKLAEVEYLEGLLSCFTKYMMDNNLSTEEPHFLWMSSPCTSMEAKTIAELYTNFRIFVEGYKALYGKVDE